ncbi:HNH endonuclease family protein [Salinactinospora qingdaonensis]|uniref:HNH endonuclease family protein n=1 Tax=Salinactinospora qingdaonensis TaxID=702744 RepID=A0ABP7GHG3_9ACTN
MGHVRRAGVVGTISALTIAGLAAPAAAYPPPPPDEAQARQELAALPVTSEGSMSGYDRDLFPHWSSQGNNCDTREVVLERDGSGVTSGGDCYPDSGSWYSVYDATWTSEPSEVHIDHLVPLAEAWRSGADSWSTYQREQFANDLGNPQLIAVSDNSNLSKSDSDPAEWQPTNTSVRCIYARQWIHVKYVYGLSVNYAEESALDGMLDSYC